MRQTKKQEFDELAKFGCGFKQTNNYGGYCVVIDDYGETALWRDCSCWSGREHTAQRWQQIKYTWPENGEPRAYITIYGRRHYLDEFMRVA